MKKIIIMLVALATLASAEVILGTDVSYNNAKGEVTASYMGQSTEEEYTDKMTALTLKGGYAWEQVRVLGYYSFEDYKESDKSKSYGVEAALLIPNDEKTDLLIGLLLGKGELEADGLDAEFIDYGAKLGMVAKLNDTLGLEVGVQYKYRKFDEMDYQGVELGGDEKLLGVYLGLNFSL